MAYVVLAEAASTTMACRLPAGTLVINHFGPSLTGAGEGAAGAPVVLGAVAVAGRAGDRDGVGDGEGDRDADGDADGDVELAAAVGDGVFEEATSAAGAASLFRCPPDEHAPTDNNPTNQNTVNARRTTEKPNQLRPFIKRCN
ncbi:hypothetical protein GCM10009835_22760 [Planosporangium flavigriseum]|uniref:Uncharacterized protein n=1 Tax=Planosporangium flavigriseum TaxID=373681 RepID=A0A8J3PP17_9ACTN|nr:hypothetical protein Pfl04_43380 [Planosporangium flavigriseum]